MIAVHGPTITEKSHLVQMLSSGYVNFIQVYDVMNGFIFASEFDKNKNLISQTRSIHNLGVLFVSCLSIGTIETESIETPYSRPVKKLLSEYLANRPPPRSLYLVEFIFGKDQVQNLLHG
jgi:hypothetical protein